MKSKIAATFLATVCLSAGLATAAATPEAKCEASKNDAAGKYAACLGKAQKSLATSGDMAKYDSAVAKCEGKIASSWTKAEGGSCVSIVDQVPIQTFLDQCNGTVAEALNTGNPLYSDIVICNSDLATCSTDKTTCNTDKATCTTGLSSCTGNLSSCVTNLSSCSANLGTCSAGSAGLGDVLAGKTFSSVAGINVAGTMANVGTQNVTPGTSAITIAQGFHSGAGAVAGDADLVPVNIASGVNIFGVVGTVTSGRLLRTGQTACYSVPGAAVPCSSSQQDGETMAGLPRAFTDNGNGTISDTVTGLMWEQLTNDNVNPLHDKDTTYTWANAIAVKINGLNGGSYAGYTDWRLPNRRELESLIYLGTPTVGGDGGTVPSAYFEFSGAACPALCTTATPCTCTFAGAYWSSTSYQTTKTSAWACNFVTGDTTTVGKTGVLPVRAVRGGL